MGPNSLSRIGRFAVLAALTAVAALAAAAPSGAATRNFVVSGTVSSSELNAIAGGTPFHGTFTVDDAAADGNPDPGRGDYPTGSLFIDVDGVGTLTLDVAPETRVRNDQAFGPLLQDTFRILAEEGGRTLPFSNDVTVAFLALSSASVGPPPTLSDDTLTGALVPALGDWTDGGEVNLTFSAAGEASCADPFVLECTVTLALGSLGEGFTLAVTKDGAGTGTVTSNPAGIDCGATCAAGFAGPVTLTATPDPGSVLLGWTGCDATAATLCMVDVTSDRTVNATFELEAAVQDIPTLSDIGLILLVALLGFAGITIRRAASRKAIAGEGSES